MFGFLKTFFKKEEPEPKQVRYLRRLDPELPLHKMTAAEQRAFWRRDKLLDLMKEVKKQ